MDDSHFPAPAPTREVVGDLLIARLRIAGELQRELGVGAETKFAPSALAEGDTTRAVASIERLSVILEERNQMNAELTNSLVQLVRRLAGEPDA